MKIKKFLAIALIATMLTSIATSCSGSDNKENTDSKAETQSIAEKTDAKKEDKKDGKEIVWLSQGVGDDSWEGQTKPILEQYAKDTGNTVKGEFYSFNDLFDVIEVKIASGSKDYDVISVDVPMVASYATRDMLSPLDEYFTDAEKKEFAESALAAGSWDGTFYGAPQNTSTQCLWYNTTMLKDAGVTMPESTTEKRLTWEEVTEMATKVKQALDPDSTKGIFGLDFQQISRVYQMNALPNSMGGKNIGDDGYTVSGVINDEAWVKSVTWYQDLVKAGVASKGINADEMGDYFYSGKLAFMVGGTWTANAAEAKGMTDYGFAPCPAFKGYEDKVGTSTGSWHFGINKASKNQETAADFTKYMTLGNGNDMWLDINGDIPARISVLDSVINNESAKGYIRIGAFEAKNTAVPRALTPGFNEYQTILGNTWEDIRNGAEVKGALDGAVSQVDTAMAQYKK